MKVSSSPEARIIFISIARRNYTGELSLSQVFFFAQDNDQPVHGFEPNTMLAIPPAHNHKFLALLSSEEGPLRFTEFWNFPKGSPTTGSVLLLSQRHFSLVPEPFYQRSSHHRLCKKLYQRNDRLAFMSAAMSSLVFAPLRTPVLP